MNPLNLATWQNVFEALFFLWDNDIYPVGLLRCTEPAHERSSLYLRITLTVISVAETVLYPPKCIPSFYSNRVVAGPVAA